MNRLIQLTEYGQSYWLDNLTRIMLDNGELRRRVVSEGLCGVTSNPTTFEKAIRGSRVYEDQIRACARSGKSAEEIYQALATTDVQRACDILRPVYDVTGGADGYVSLEVSPHLARHTEASIDEARRLARYVGRPNLMIKIPGTVEGLPAIEQLLFEGINVNITLLFSVDRYERVAETYIRALERRAQAGIAVDNVASVASFFLSRIDVMVDRLLEHQIALEGVSTHTPRHPRKHLGAAAIANAKLAYDRFKRIQAKPAWRALSHFGARPQRLLWASTGTKNPSYSDVMYVEPLIGPGTVNTMPEKTISAFADHGRVEETMGRGMSEAAATMRNLHDLGIDMDRVTAQLEDEGIEKFIEPYDALLHGLERKRTQYAGADTAGDVAQLTEIARQLRRDVIRMTTAAGSGHPTSCLSSADIMAALFFRVMRWDPGDATARDVDSFVLSKGHAAPILWAALARAGAIDEDIDTLRRIDSTLEGHPTPRNPWVRVATGSLGQGLAAANGIAIANRLDGIDARVYCLLGDGECSEGSVWESAQFAALQGFGNIVAIIDANGFGQSGPAPYNHDTEVLAQRFRAFGWRAVEIDGHDLTQVTDALAQTDVDRPTAVVARTLKGKGVSLVEDEDGWHGKALSREQMDRALSELGEPRITPTVPPRRLGGRQPRPVRLASRPAVPDYPLGEEVATRDAYGAALRDLGARRPDVVAIDGDVADSTRTKEFAEAFPDRFFEGFIAEQNMVGTALGLAAYDKTPYVSTFACFLSRAADFIRMAGHSRPRHLVFCGSHAGVSTGADGPSQMGLEDLALFRALNASTVICPCDPVSAYRLTQQAASVDGIVYLRVTRPKTPVIYDAEEQFPVGGSKTLRATDNDQVTLVAAGITVHEALAAHQALQRRGIAARVIDAYSVKPLDKATLDRAAAETGSLIIVEDHWIDGGLGDAVAALASGADILRLAVRSEPRSGSSEALLDRHGISRRAIERAVLGKVSASAAHAH